MNAKHLLNKVFAVKSAIIAGLVVGMVSCVPNLYFVDRHTVMEIEASGEWPAMDQQLMQSNKKEGVTFFEKEKDQRRRKSVFTTLNGEFTAKQ